MNKPQIQVSIGEGNGTPLQYFCLENPMDGGAWLRSMGSLESDTTERLHFHFSLSCIGEGNGNIEIINLLIKIGLIFMW